MRSPAPIARATLAVAATIGVFMALSPVLEDKESGLLGVVSDVSWFGLLALVPALLALLAIGAVRRFQGSRS